MTMRDWEQQEFESDLVPPEMRAISYYQLLDVERKARRFYVEVRGESYGSYKEKTMRDIVRDIIIPECEEDPTYETEFPEPQSYAFYLNGRRGLRADAFVTHCWDGPFHEFLASIKHAFERKIDKPNLWICSFALIQGHTAHITRELGSVPIRESPFVRAIEYTEDFVVVRNSKEDLYSRSWCVCELLYAQEHNKFEDKKVYVLGQNVFANETTLCQDAEASDPQDEGRIREELGCRGFESINRLIKELRQYPPDVDSSERRIRKRTRYATRVILLALLAIFNVYGTVSNPLVKQYIYDAIQLKLQPLTQARLAPSQEKAAVGPANLWVSEELVLAELESVLGNKRILVLDERRGVPFPSHHMTLSQNQHGRYISGKKTNRELCIVELSISGQNLTEIPETITKFQRLVFLDLSHNDLTILPDVFHKFPSLDFIDLRGNPNLKSLPDSLNATNLKGTLLLDGDWGERVAEGQLEAVRDIEKAINQTLVWALEGGKAPASRRPNVGGFPIYAKTEDALYRDAKGLVVVGSQTGDVNELLLQGHGLSTLPSSIGSLKHLWTLLLSGNDFTAVPDVFANIEYLTLLDLTDNPKVEKAPESLRTSIHSHTTHFLLADPVKVPRDFLLDSNQMIAIEDLENRTAGLHIPVKAQLTYGNSSAGMSLWHGRVQSLSLVGQNITFIDDSFGLLIRLGHLNLTNNQLEHLPDVFDKIPTLRHVDLRGNPHLKRLPPTLIAKKHLLHLHLPSHLAP